MFDDLDLFLRIVQKGGLAAAGRELGLSPASVSEKLAGLERYYGVTLLTRTTRAVSLTDEGRILVESARRLLAEAEELENRLRLGAEQLSGPIHLSAPEDMGRQIVVPVIDAFLTEHAAVSVDLNLTDGYVDLVAQGMDFAIRHGSLADSTLKVRPLGEDRRIVCAAPSYLDGHGTPLHPEELCQHECLLMRFGQNIDRVWPFMINGKVQRIIVEGRRIANDGRLVRQWCKEGRGIALKSIRDIGAELKSGELVALLEEFAIGGIPLQIVYPASAVQPVRVRALIDKIAQAFDSISFA